MRRIVIWLASTVTVVVLLFGYHTSTDNTTAATTSTSSSAPPTTGSTTSSGSGSGSSSSSTKSSSSSSRARKTYTGSVADTQWGPVELKITVKDGKITKVTVLQQPSGNPRDTEINAQALPILIDETLQKQSATIDMVSGATVTSTGYLQSLQAALDKAGL